MNYFRYNPEEELQELYRQAAIGDTIAQQKLTNRLERLGLTIDTWLNQTRLLEPPTDPYDWTDTVDAWLMGDNGAYLLEFGAYGNTKIVVIDSSLEDALETAAHWLSQNAPGIFTDPEWNVDADGNCNECGANFGTDFCEHRDEDVNDLTYTESGWIANWEWTANELDPIKTMASMFASLQKERQKIPTIAVGLFWNVWFPHQGDYKNYKNINTYYPAKWSEDRVRNAAQNLQITLGDSKKWFIHEPQNYILYCFREPDNDPLGKDAEKYASLWMVAQDNYGFEDDEELWCEGARALLRDT